MSNIVIPSRRFISHVNRRRLNNKRLKQILIYKLDLFIKNPEHPELRPHKLKDDLEGLLSFWVTGEYRVIYKKNKSGYLLIDFGKHKQVYPSWN